MDALIGGMTQDCFNDVVGAPEPFVGPAQTAERYRKHWEGFPDFAVRVRRILCADESCVVTENVWHVPGVAADRETGANARDRGLALQRAMRYGARRSFSIMPRCSSKSMPRSKFRRPQAR
jgi:hypothetical protein